MREYKTKEIADLIGIHSNTVRLYEEIGFISKPKRKKNGYRVFTDEHLAQIALVRLALRGEILLNGLRKEAIEVIKSSAKRDYEGSIEKTENYLKHLRLEYKNAEEAIRVVKEFLIGEESKNNNMKLTRKDTADYLGVTIDTLRNWELNGLINIPRKENGFRIYTEKEIQILKIIRTLRCANYSLMSILRMLTALRKNNDINIQEVINTPDETEDIINVCDRLLSCLRETEEDANKMLEQLNKMKLKFL